MFDLLVPVTDPVRRSGLFRPTAIGIAGALGVAIARNAVEYAPVVVFGAVTVVVVATVLRERGLAVMALGVGAAAAWATPAGLGPLFVVTGVVIGARPALVDGRVAQWPEIVDAVIGVPGLAGLASVAAGQPSARGGFVAATAGAFVVATWWRGPRHEIRVGQPTIAAYLGSLAALVVTLAPDRLGRLGELPRATATAGRGLAAALAVFGVVCVIEAVRDVAR